MLKAGRANLPCREPVPELVSGYEAGFVTGGRSADCGLRDSLSTLPFAVAFVEQPVFGGERGGFEFLQSRGLSGWVLDLAKSQLKISAPGRRWTFPRDWTRLRISGELLSAEVPSQRRRLREFIAYALQIATAESDVVVARGDVKERWNNFTCLRSSAGRGPLSISVFRFNPRYFSRHAFRK